MDDTLDQWEKLAQCNSETVLEYAQRLEKVQLQLELEGEALSGTQHYHKFQRNLRTKLPHAGGHNRASGQLQEACRKRKLRLNIVRGLQFQLKQGLDEYNVVD